MMKFRGGGGGQNPYDYRIGKKEGLLSMNRHKGCHENSALYPEKLRPSGVSKTCPWYHSIFCSALNLLHLRSLSSNPRSSDRLLYAVDRVYVLQRVPLWGNTIQATSVTLFLTFIMYREMCWWPAEMIDPCCFLIHGNFLVIAHDYKADLSYLLFAVYAVL